MLDAHQLNALNCQMDGAWIMSGEGTKDEIKRPPTGSRGVLKVANNEISDPKFALVSVQLVIFVWKPGHRTFT